MAACLRAVAGKRRGVSWEWAPAALSPGRRETPCGLAPGLAGAARRRLALRARSRRKGKEKAKVLHSQRRPLPSLPPVFGNVPFLCNFFFFFF